MTQSVCKHCPFEIYFSDFYKSWLHKKVVAETLHVAEPVSEPASIGEPPPKDYQETLKEKLDWIFENYAYAGDGPSRLNAFFEDVKRAARPSEPSAPKTGYCHSHGEKLVPIFGGQWNGCPKCPRDADGFTPSVPQTSAEPQHETTDCLHDFGGYPMGTYKGHFYPSPQSVSDPAPSPTPSVSTEPLCPECKSLLTMDGNPPTPSGCSNENCPSATYPAAPSVAGTPIKHHPNCVTQASYIAKYSRPDLRGKPCDCGASQGTPQVEGVARPEKCECGHKWHGDDPCTWTGEEEGMELHCECPASHVIFDEQYFLTHGVGAPAQPGPQTRFDDFDDAAHPCNIWWKEHGQFMMSGGGRREFIWACRGWIAREQFAEGVEVTGESMHETPPAAPGSVPQAPKCSEPRIVELNPPNAPDKYAVFIGKVFIWEFDFEKEAEELRDNLKRVGVPQAEPPKEGE